MVNFLPCTSKDLNLDVVLLNGQSFRWQKIEDQDSRTIFIGISKNRIWKLWRENPDKIGFEVIGRFSRAKSASIDEDLKSIQDFFQLDVNLPKLYSEWENKDNHFSKIVQSNRTLFEGIRILKLDPIEAVFTFICTSNNNLKRITAMVNRLCMEYGERIEISDNSYYYDFPTLEQFNFGLINMETTLRNEGFGYRASYITEAVKKLLELGGAEWLNSLKNEPYLIAKQKLIQIPGIGPKVADCICLFGLQKHHVVPVDVHVFKITTSVYMTHLKNKKSVTKTMHEEIGKFYEDYFGSYAGWCHSVLFTARLKYFGANPSVEQGRSTKIEITDAEETVVKKYRK